MGGVARLPRPTLQPPLIHPNSVILSGGAHGSYVSTGVERSRYSPSYQMRLIPFSPQIRSGPVCEKASAIRGTSGTFGVPSTPLRFAQDDRFVVVRTIGDRWQRPLLPQPHRVMGGVARRPATPATPSPPHQNSVHCLVKGIPPGLKPRGWLTSIRGAKAPR